MKCNNRIKIIIKAVEFLWIIINQATAQQGISWTRLQQLPDVQGYAGMFAGVTQDKIICMGGANFPDDPPWKGGQKKWYSTVFMLDKHNRWIKLNDTLPFPLAYGVSVNWKDKIIIVGGSSYNEHSDKVFTISLNGYNIQLEQFPSLPIPIANMSGAIVKDLLIIVGGSQQPQGPPLKTVYALDLNSIGKGWLLLPSWPGKERNFPVCASDGDKFYMFSGETVGININNESYRYILQDAYVLDIDKENVSYQSQWKILSPLPLGASAGPTPLPILKNGSIIIWGGVDAVTALHTDPVTHPGISKIIQVYNPGNNSWQLKKKKSPARVTLPVVFWKNRWVYISGEIRPGVRTNIIEVLNDQL